MWSNRSYSFNVGWLTVSSCSSPLPKISRSLDRESNGVSLSAWLASREGAGMRSRRIQIALLAESRLQRCFTSAAKGPHWHWALCSRILLHAVMKIERGEGKMSVFFFSFFSLFRVYVTWYQFIRNSSVSKIFVSFLKFERIKFESK